MRILSALIVIVTSLGISGFFAILVSNNSTSDTASRNMIAVFLIIFVPLMFIGFQASKRLLSRSK